MQRLFHMVPHCHSLLANRPQPTRSGHLQRETKYGFCSSNARASCSILRSASSTVTPLTSCAYDATHPRYSGVSAPAHATGSHASCDAPEQSHKQFAPTVHPACGSSPGPSSPFAADQAWLQAEAPAATTLPDCAIRARTTQSSAADPPVACPASEQIRFRNEPPAANLAHAATAQHTFPLPGTETPQVPSEWR